ncbi:hypothetical protein [Diplocloster hominis]|uniref:hypothetical protein n=1 Tax=Diplocloster hominis TaxID=3079010 RepID=UPI0031BA265F
MAAESSFLSYIIGCIKGYSRVDFREYVRGKSINTVDIIMNSNNPSNENIVYYIKTGNAFSGFGAQLRRTLEALAYADYFGFIPYVEYTKDFLYGETEKINECNNPFEYYFTQPSMINDQNLYSYNWIYYNEEHRKIVNKLGYKIDSYSVSEEYITYMAFIIKKHLNINAFTKDYLNNSYKSLNLKNIVIGVHVRGTDFNTGYKNHPAIITVRDYFDVIDSILAKEKTVSCIFLATDEQNIIESFQNRYGTSVTYYDDVYRSSDGSPIHFSKDQRNNHHYKLGLEILRDIITLSKADYLIAGNSQVSYCARMFKKSFDEDYKDKIILDSGLYK